MGEWAITSVLPVIRPERMSSAENSSYRPTSRYRITHAQSRRKDHQDGRYDDQCCQKKQAPRLIEA